MFLTHSAYVIELIILLAAVIGPGGRRRADVPGTTRVGFSDRALERAEADRDGVLAWALGQGYLTHADLRL